MTWERKKVLVTVKAAPESSKKYGDCICTAGITEEGELIRLYPIPLSLFQTGKGFKKFDWIEVECKNVSDEEKLKRKESYKIRAGTLKVVDSSLSGPRRIDWNKRNSLVYPSRAGSLEELKSAYDEDRTSLGIIRVADIEDFYRTEDLTNEEKEGQKLLQMTFDKVGGGDLSLRPQWILEQIPHVFKYRFSCEGSACSGHDVTCEDWELFEANRKYPARYGNTDLAWEKLRDRFFRFFKEERELHFFMGTYSLFPSWMIIGLYYPPKARD